MAANTLWINIFLDYCSLVIEGKAWAVYPGICFFRTLCWAPNENIEFRSIRAAVEVGNFIQMCSFPCYSVYWKKAMLAWIRFIVYKNAPISWVFSEERIKETIFALVELARRKSVRKWRLVVERLCTMPGRTTVPTMWDCSPFTTKQWTFFLTENYRHVYWLLAPCWASNHLKNWFIDRFIPMQ